VYKSDSTSHLSIQNMHPLQDVMMIVKLLSNTTLLAPREKVSSYISQSGVVTKSETGNRTQDKTLLHPLVSLYIRPHVSHVTYRTGHPVTPRNLSTVKEFQLKT